MSVDSQAKILVVEDEAGLADLYATWLADDYHVESVYTGSDAIDRVDDETDIVLLDRRMPGLSGDDVLNHIRENGFDCQVAMVSGIEPDFDIIDMKIDDYRVKPLEKNELTDLVENLAIRATENGDLQDYYRGLAKLRVLCNEKSETERNRSDTYATLRQRIKDLHEQVDPPGTDVVPVEFDEPFP